VDTKPDFLQTSTDLVSGKTIYFKREAENGNTCAPVPGVAKAKMALLMYVLLVL
jgi:hypothetical protein